MIGVADGDRQRVGFIRAVELGLGKQEADHGLDLLLFGVPGADHRLLDLVRRVFRDAQALHRRGQKRRAPRLAELQRRARVLVDERLFDRRFVGRKTGDDAAQSLEQFAQAIGEVLVAGRGDDARGHIGEPHAVAVDDAPAGAAEAGIDPEDANQSGFHGALHSTRRRAAKARAFGAADRAAAPIRPGSGPRSESACARLSASFLSFQ